METILVLVPSGEPLVWAETSGVFESCLVPYFNGPENFWFSPCQTILLSHKFFLMLKPFHELGGPPRAGLSQASHPTFFTSMCSINCTKTGAYQPVSCVLG